VLAISSSLDNISRARSPASTALVGLQALNSVMTLYDRQRGAGIKWFKQLDAVHEYLASRDWPAVSEARYSLSKKRYDKVVKGFMDSF